MNCKRRILQILLVVCLISVAFSATGCRKSPALIDNIYTKDAIEVDPERLEARSDAADEYDESVSSQDVEQDILPELKEQTVAANAADENNDSPSKNIESNNLEHEQLPGTSDNNAKTDEGAVSQSGGSGEGSKTGTNSNGGSGGIEPDLDDENGASNLEEQGHRDSENAESNNPEGEPSSDPTDVENNPSVEEEPGGNGTSVPSKKELPRKTVTDGTGTEQDIPRDVYSVTAVGAAAPIVEMIGGTGRLLASSADFTQGELANVLCDDVAAGMVNTWWNDDGTDPISSENFQLLLEQSPDVCFVIGNQKTFDTERGDFVALQEAGIGCVFLPELNSSDNIKQAVNIVAAVLETNESTGIEAKYIARDYSNWVDEIMSGTARGGSGQTYYTIYVHRWDDSIRFVQKDDSRVAFRWESLPSNLDGFGYDGVGYGMAIGWTTEMQAHSPFQSFLNAGGAVDTSEYRCSLTYLGTGKKERLLFPFTWAFGLNFLTNIEAYHTYPTTNDQFFFVPTYDVGEILFGNTDLYNTVIAEDESVASKISYNTFWQYYTSEFWWNYGDGPGAAGANRVQGPYDIWVCPHGFSTWSEGAVDSPLLAFWAGSRISKTVSYDDLRNEVSWFYEYFFGKRISEDLLYRIIGYEVPYCSITEGY